jgi:hypothetical protein
MDFQLKIKVGIGLSELKFGSSMSEAENLFGKADKIEDVNELNFSPSILWHYFRLGFSIFFEANNSQSFICVDVINEECTLWDKDIFSYTEKQIIQLFKEKGIYLYEQEQQTWGEKRLSFDEANIDFYFEKNTLISINYGLITEGTQTLILPN